MTNPNHIPPNLTSQKLIKRPPYKFLRRTLKLGTRDDASYRLFTVKRFYLKKILDSRDTTDFIPDYQLSSRLFKRAKKLLKTLKTVVLSSFFEPHVFEILKYSRNLQKYGYVFDSEEDKKTDDIAVYLKRISPQTQNIYINIWIYQFNDDYHNVYRIAKTLCRFRKLKNFDRCYMLHTDENESYLSKELLIYSRMFSRMKELNNVTCQLTHGEEQGLKRAMRMGVVYPGITGLEIRLESRYFPNSNQMEPFFGPDVRDYQELFRFENLTEREKRIYQRVKDNFRREDEEKEEDLRNMKYKTLPDENLNLTEDQQQEEEEIDNNSSDWTDDDSSDAEDGEFTARCIMREEMRPFYRFELFPNLKYLYLHQGDHLYPLGPFVIDGFKALNNLESLTIDILSRSMGTKFIFQGLIHLPLLKKFSLRINFMNPWDWDFLSNFILTQNRLEALSLKVDSDNRIRPGLWRILENLKEKPLLKYLELKSSDWSLEAFSKGLSQLNVMNQLHTFKLQGNDLPGISDQKLQKRMEGLSKFIENQKGSLKKLEIATPLVLEENLVNYLGEAISKLTKLTDLHMEINYKRDYPKFLIERGVAIPEKWNPNLGKYLRKLENLEIFTFNCAILNPDKPDSAKWFGEVFQGISSLESLRKINMTCYAWGALKKEEPKMAAALRELRNIEGIWILVYDEIRNFMVLQNVMGPVIPAILEKQAKRTDLTF